MGDKTRPRIKALDLNSSRVPANLGCPLSKNELTSLASRIDLRAFHDAVVAVTGGQGFLGNYLTQAICEVASLQGYRPRQVLSIGRRQISENQAWSRKFSFFEHRVNPLNFHSRLPESEIFLHCASPASPSKYGNASEIWEANLGAAVSVLKSPHPPDRFLFVSSGEVYGAGGNSPESQIFRPGLHEFGPRSHYPNAKIMTEKFLTTFGNEAGTTVKIARLFHTFGPGIQVDDGRSFADILWSAARGDDIQLYSEGSAIRFFAYIEDSAAGIFALLSSADRTTVADVGGDKGVSILDFAEMASNATRAVVRTKVGETQGNRIEAPPETAKPQLSLLKTMGWSNMVGLPEGIERTIRHMKASL